MLLECIQNSQSIESMLHTLSSKKSLSDISTIALILSECMSQMLDCA